MILILLFFNKLLSNSRTSSLICHISKSVAPIGHRHLKEKLRSCLLLCLAIMEMRMLRSCFSRNILNRKQWCQKLDKSLSSLHQCKIDEFAWDFCWDFFKESFGSLIFICNCVVDNFVNFFVLIACLLYTSTSPRD